MYVCISYVCTQTTYIFVFRLDEPTESYSFPTASWRTLNKSPIYIWWGSNIYSKNFLLDLLCNICNQFISFCIWYFMSCKQISVILSQVREKEKYCWQCLKWYKWTYLQSRNKLTDLTRVRVERGTVSLGLTCTCCYI